MNQPPTTMPPQQADLMLNASEFSQLAEASFAFMEFTVMLTGIVNPKAYDATLTALQRMRGYLDKFTPFFKKADLLPPVAAIDELAKKPVLAAPVRAQLAFMCACTADRLQLLLTQALALQHARAKQARSQTQEPIKIDPEKLKKMN